MTVLTLPPLFFLSVLQTPILDDISSLPCLLVPLWRLRLQNYLKHIFALVQAPAAALYKNTVTSQHQSNPITQTLSWMAHIGFTGRSNTGLPASWHWTGHTTPVLSWAGHSNISPLDCLSDVYCVHWIHLNVWLRTCKRGECQFWAKPASFSWTQTYLYTHV